MENLVVEFVGSKKNPSEIAVEANLDPRKKETHKRNPSLKVTFDSFSSKFSRLDRDATLWEDPSFFQEVSFFI